MNKQENFKYIADYDRKLVKRLIKNILDRGLSIGINDGEERVIFDNGKKRSTKAVEIYPHIGSTGEDIILLFEEQTDGRAKRLGHFYLIYNNGRGDTIADYRDCPLCSEIDDQVTTD